MGRNKILIGICDDEDFFINQIRFACVSVLENITDNFDFVIFHSGEEVLQYRGEMMDLLFLDIELRGMDGIAVMNSILHSSYIWRIVFASTHEELVWETFSIKTLGFTRKPMSEQAIEKYIKTALTELQKDVTIPFSKFDEDRRVRLSELYYIEGSASYIEVHTVSGKFIVSGKLGDWEKKLADFPLVRIHKSFMINLAHVDPKGNIATVTPTGELLPIGRRFKPLFQEKYTQFVLESVRERN